MDVYVYLIPLTMVLVAALAAFFFWGLKNKQYEDLEGAGERMLHQDERSKIDASKNN